MRIRLQLSELSSVCCHIGTGRRNGSWSGVDGIVIMIREWTVRGSNPSSARYFLHSKIVQTSVSQTFLRVDPFWLRKITTDFNLLAPELFF